MRNDHIATLKKFPGKSPKDRVKEVGVHMREGLSEMVKKLFPQAEVVVDQFHITLTTERLMVSPKGAIPELKS